MRHGEPMAAAAPRKRPLYLVLALLAALALGTLGSCGAWAEIAQYRGGVSADAFTAGIAHEDDKAVVAARAQAYVRAFDAAEPRGYPLAVAALLLGAAVAFFAMRAMSGSPAARSALVQLVLAQAALGVGSYFALRDVHKANLSLVDAQVAAAMREQITDPQMADQVVRLDAKMIHVLVPVLVAARTLAGLLVVVALTRRRSRDFFDAAAAALEER
jgi:hypothetical protein